MGGRRKLGDTFGEKCNKRLASFLSDGKEEAVVSNKSENKSRLEKSSCCC